MTDARTTHVLTGAKVHRGCTGVTVSTLGAAVGQWDPADPRVAVESYGIEAEDA